MTTISITAPLLVEGTFNCADVFNVEEVERTKKEQKEENGEREPAKAKGEDFIALPLEAPPATPTSAPSAVGHASSPTTATAQGSLRVKAAKGVLVKPEVQKLPSLAPGASWTVSVHVQASEKAKPSSTLSLTGTAPGVSATSSLVVKLAE